MRYQSAHKIILHDNIIQNVYCYGAPTSPAVIFSLPLGTPYIALDDLFFYLSTSFYIVACETRGSPGSGGFSEREFHLRDHANDIATVQSFLHLEKPILAGWCTGALIALIAASLQSSCSTRGLLLLHPPVPSFEGMKKSPELSGYELIAKSIWSDESRYPAFLSLILRSRVKSDQDEQFVTSCVNDLYKDDPDSFRRFALLSYNMQNDGEFFSLISNMDASCHILLAEDDSVSLVENVNYLLRFLKKVESFMVVPGTHYSLRSRAETAAAIESMLRRCLR